MKSPEEQNSNEEKYQKLVDQLYASSTWPNQYLFKFILLKDPIQEKKLLAIFDNMGAVITSKLSKTEKYISFSIQAKFNSPEDIIIKYKEVGQKIKGILSL